MRWAINSPQITWSTKWLRWNAKHNHEHQLAGKSLEKLNNHASINTWQLKLNTTSNLVPIYDSPHDYRRTQWCATPLQQQQHHQKGEALEENELHLHAPRARITFREMFHSQLSWSTLRFLLERDVRMYCNCSRSNECFFGEWDITESTRFCTF